jgi:N-acetylmuramoyl-L-alanine amidase
MRPDMVVLHYTGMADGEAALRLLCTPESRLSSHYVVFEDGRIVQLVAEARRAWHAGVSSWQGETDINSRSIGIEIVNPGHGLGYPDFPEAEIAAVIALTRDILARHPIRADRVVAHSDVAPSRKQDPGEKFPWRRLHAAGIGHWVEPVAITDGAGLVLGDRGGEVMRLQQALGAYGYAIPTSGEFDLVTRDVVTAFQRHFRPARVDGRADRSTIETLECLLARRRA